MANESRIGKAAEYLIAASVMLATEGEVNVSTSLVDDEGVDLVFHRRGATTTLAVQVKTRTTSTTSHRDGGWIQANVRSATFSARPDLAVLIALVDKPSASLQWAWLIPSQDYAEKAMSVRNGALLRFAASAKDGTKDKWSEYRVAADGLAQRILERLMALDEVA